ncbi:menaquinone biosynthesis protein 2-succinyl-6-hydroxy-2,4-cyclohexadiene-1-carboxylate synthase [Cyanobium sp. PCC 7001]|uniref:2-succinyl-5-enolpyruvyl-6-hydroxy-3- cyclohexene-1-carboxylic-acid synthase n=1 Tax=Cyanobium sp. PCC 7001 TaxID=180281 RepID=UPI0001804C39|nr:2-succinyl-5-enolpyruvyl-6-hydroxy-3-cyclohexene-1-carboxylic-acid synthase [Cyanobium sp. PCC 7001]EDY38984.1 menaquinone biosynthesis protein 2-succinyl-6-hydroxy-2,4-cyclohexadiene-1-carboxylate synthase [Cyanobium sp. PCC 7001]
MDLARRNLEAALLLLQALVRQGLGLVVLCPGSRSAPLAVAAALVEGEQLQLHTAVDERSAAFFALGWSRAAGRAAAVITTSGTAVANLLPAVVEADFGTIPLLLITADRPRRLQGCGANQTVNQQDFLASNVRDLLRGDGDGLALMAPQALEQLAARAMAATTQQPPGPVHVNLPIEEPLHADAATLRGLKLSDVTVEAPSNPAAAASSALPGIGLGGLDPDAPGLVVAGPWRGLPQGWPAFCEALRLWQQRTGWPVLADGLSGLRGEAGLVLVGCADLCQQPAAAGLLAPQVLRLGPLSASRRLQELLRGCAGRQLLISEAEPRCLDALAMDCPQWPGGLARWWQQLPTAAREGSPAAASLALADRWCRLETTVQAHLGEALAPPAWGEPAIARQLSLLLPAGLPLVIANSSPVRDWDSFTPASAPARPVFSFRGASGIDGTLSLACGVAEAWGEAVLLSGDLALLHDSNGWLWHRRLRGRLTVVLIDNGGGGIFEQLAIRPDGETTLDFERLFAMPQAVDPLRLAAAHGVPARSVAIAAELPAALAWARAQPMALMRLATDRRRDAAWRHDLRRMATALAPRS